MIPINEMKQILSNMLTPLRYSHSLKVMEASIRLAGKYGADTEKAAIAGLVHDCAKDMKKDTIIPACEKYGIIIDDIEKEQPHLLHGKIGAHMAKELFDIQCPEILAAIADHTMGRPGMDKLSSIVFVADYIEESRDFEGVDKIRKAAEESLEKAIVTGIDGTIWHILVRGQLLHPQTVDTRNWALRQLSLMKKDAEAETK